MMINIALRRLSTQHSAAFGRFHCVVSSHSQKNVSSIFAFAIQQRSILPRSFATDSPGRKKFEDYIESLSPARKKFHYILGKWEYC